MWGFVYLGATETPCLDEKMFEISVIISISPAAKGIGSDFAPHILHRGLISCAFKDMLTFLRSLALIIMISLFYLKYFMSRIGQRFPTFGQFQCQSCYFHSALAWCNSFLWFYQRGKLTSQFLSFLRRVAQYLPFILIVAELVSSGKIWSCSLLLEK